MNARTPEFLLSADLPGFIAVDSMVRSSVWLAFLDATPPPPPPLLLLLLLPVPGAVAPPAPSPGPGPGPTLGDAVIASFAAAAAAAAAADAAVAGLPEGWKRRTPPREVGGRFGEAQVWSKPRGTRRLLLLL